MIRPGDNALASPSQAGHARANGPGFYGKLPSRGDFVTFGLTGAFLSRWDDWLGAGLEALRLDIGRQWEALLDAGPAWRFVLPAGLVGPCPMVGVMTPSRDKVARRFPFVIACPMAVGWDEAAALPAVCRDWFDLAEVMAQRLVARGAEPVFARKVVDALGRPSLPAPERVADGAAVVAGIIGTVPTGFSLWWTRGGGPVTASMTVAPEMPSAPLFAALLDGDWSGHGWLDLCAPTGLRNTIADPSGGFVPRDPFSGLMPLAV